MKIYGRFVITGPYLINNNSFLEVGRGVFFFRAEFNQDDT